MSQVMRRRGVIAMTAVRLVPLAPFAVVNVVAGAIRMRFRCTSSSAARIGILPGTLVATVFGDQLVTGFRDPRSINPWLIAALVAIAGCSRHHLARASLAVAAQAIRMTLFDVPSVAAPSPR